MLTRSILFIDDYQTGIAEEEQEISDNDYINENQEQSIVLN